MSKNTEYEESLKRSATEALAKIPEEAKPAARASRSQIYNWLMGMHTRTQNVAMLATDDMADVACQAFEKVCKTNSDDKWANLLKAFEELDDDDQLNLMRFALGSGLKAAALGAALMTRSSDVLMWENTGFHADSGLQCVFAKVGQAKYQPIGFDDGEFYIGTEGSKTLWLRKFAMAIMLPYEPPFEVKIEEVTPEKISDDTKVSDAERDKIMEIIGYFNEDIEAWSGLTPDDTDKREELADKMRETLKLATLRLPRLEAKLDQLKDEHPEVGADFQNVNIAELVYSCREFLNMKLDDDSVRRTLKSTTLMVGDEREERTKLINGLIDRANILLEVDPPIVSDVETWIEQVLMSVPEVKDSIEPDSGMSLADTAKTLISSLQKLVTSKSEEAT